MPLLQSWCREDSAERVNRNSAFSSVLVHACAGLHQNENDPKVPVA